MPKIISERLLISALIDSRSEALSAVASRYGMSPATLRKWRNFATAHPKSNFAQQYKQRCEQTDKPIKTDAVNTARNVMGFLNDAIAQSDPQNREHVARAIQGVEAVSRVLEAVRA